MEAREEKGLAIAAQSKLTKTDKGYLVPSQTGKGLYLVNMDSNPACSCPDFEARHLPCKHIYAVEFTIRREERPDGTTIVTKTMRVTYGQNWPAYNAAQTHEQEQFGALLRELCDTVPQPPQTFGRPRLPLSDVLFGIGIKVYSTMSGRRAMTDFRDAQAKGLLDKAPSFTSTFRYLEDPDLAPVLKSLIEQSALPLRSVETDFAVDSSGFSTSVYNRWFDHKWGKVRKEAQWVKAHLMCGVKTNIVTSVEVTPTDSADAPYLAPFVQTTARNFKVVEVSGDKAYLSKRNLRAVQAVGGTAYIPFKTNSVSHQGHHKRDSLWERTYHYYNLNRAEFLAHYHKRSNVETTFSMVKAKFGGAVRSKELASIGV
jgi:transposase